MGKSNAQRQKEWRDRQKVKLAADQPQVPVLTQALHSAEPQFSTTPFDPDAWWRSVEGIMSQGIAMRVQCLANEPFSEYDARVRAASGPGPWELEADEPAKRRIQMYRKLGANPPPGLQQQRMEQVAR